MTRCFLKKYEYNVKLLKYESQYRYTADMHAWVYIYKYKEVLIMPTASQPWSFCGDYL